MKYIEICFIVAGELLIPAKKDGLERITWIISKFQVLTAAVMFPSFLYCIHYNLPLFRFFNLDSILLTSLISGLLSMIGISDLVLAIPATFAIFIHLNVTAICLEKLREAW
jgi:hypothetical protein